jgi:glycosyltransferase involved in cell wall biosynthesis
MSLGSLVAIPLVVVYGGMAFIAATNYFLMRRPKSVTSLGNSELRFTVLIPARNEAENLRELLPQLTPFAQVVVFDDESVDETGEVARSLGAIVIRPVESLPKGWTGKNRACHQLGLAASQIESDRWIFLDADVRISTHFFDSISQAARQTPEVGCFSAFPNLRPGRFPEPLVLAWVGWILLATNPFGLVSAVKKGHNRFTNGQITIWKPEVWLKLKPNEYAKNRILEDVVIGRYLAQQKIRVDVLNLSDVMSVRMYETWREALNGMSKNSFEIMNSYVGALGLSCLLVAISIAWIWWLPGYVLLALSGFFAFSVCRPLRTNPLPMILASLLLPLAVMIGALTIIRSCYWKKAGKTEWKGRIYA